MAQPKRVHFGEKMPMRLGLARPNFRALISTPINLHYSISLWLCCDHSMTGDFYKRLGDLSWSYAILNFGDNLPDNLAYWLFCFPEVIGHSRLPACFLHDQFPDQVARECSRWPYVFCYGVWWWKSGEVWQGQVVILTHAGTHSASAFPRNLSPNWFGTTRMNVEAAGVGGHYSE